MTPFDYYRHALQHDLVTLVVVFWLAGVITMIPSWLLAWGTAENIDGVTNGRLVAASGWAWFVASCAATWGFLFGLGITVQLQRAGRVQPDERITLVVLALIVSLVLTLVVTYRSTRRYLMRCVELRFSPRLAAEVQKARQARFSLRSLVLCQVFGIASFGLWLECHRDGARRLSARVTEEQEHEAWVNRMRERNFEKYGWVARSDGWTKPRLQLITGGPQPTLDDEALLLIVPDDRITKLEVRSDQITDEGLRIIGGLATLRELTIESNCVTDQGIAELQRLPHLRRLTLKCPQVTDASLTVLSQFPPRTCIAVETAQIPAGVAERFAKEHFNVSFPPDGGVAVCCLR